MQSLTAKQPRDRMTSPSLRLSLAAGTLAVGLAGVPGIAWADFPGVCAPNKIVAGPASGAAAVPECRSLVVADIPPGFISSTNGAIVTPAFYGCSDSNGGTDDTVCIQNAINTAASAGLCLFFDTAHLYSISATLNLTIPPCLLGPYHYGIWPVNQPTGTGPVGCPWGLSTKATGITMLNASAVTGTIDGLCIDMTGGQSSVNPNGGAAIQIAPANITAYSSGWRVEHNTILNPFDGITVPGNGPGTGCCGIGTSADGDIVSQNTIVSPADAGIAIGKNSASVVGGPATVGITLDDNSIVCKTATSKTNAYGVVLYEGGVSYNGHQNGPEGCHIGTAVIPGVLAGYVQHVQFDGDGVFGDQSGLYNLLVQPVGGAVQPLTIGGKEPWANAAISGQSVLIDCTNANTCNEFTIRGLIANSGGYAGPAVDIEGGVNGPYDLTYALGTICAQNTTSPSAIGLKLNAGSGATGRWIAVNNRIGRACFGGSGPLPTGIQLIINAGSTANGSITLTGNDLSATTTPIAYTPSQADHVLAAYNMGVDDTTQTLASATTVSLSNAFPSYFITGTTTIATINGQWQGRRIRFAASGGGSITTNTAGNICSPVASAVQALDLIWLPGGTCWSHIP